MALIDLFSVSTAHAAAFTQSYTTDRNGGFRVRVASPLCGPLELTVQAGDTTQTFTVNVEDGGLAIRPGSPLPYAWQNVLCSQTLTVSGGMAPYILNVTSGALPPGVTLSGDTISGRPTVTGTFTFTVTVTDSPNPAGTASKQFTLKVIDPTAYSLEAAPNNLDLHTPPNTVD